MQLVYDGSFEGLLCALDAACHDAAITSLVSCHAAQPQLFSAGDDVRTSPAQAARFSRRLRDASSRAVLRNVLYNYLSELAGFEDTLLAYVRMALQHGARADSYHAHDAVRAVHGCARKVGHEIHRLSGLARFRELRDGTLWAPVNPDHNVVCAVAAHFTRRMPAAAWIVYDMQRGYGVRWDTRDCALVVMDEEMQRQVQREPAGGTAIYSDAELAYQRMWRGYFETIAIAARRNPALQRRNMPQRYWPYLIERPARTAPAPPAQ